MKLTPSTLNTLLAHARYALGDSKVESLREHIHAVEGERDAAVKGLRELVQEKCIETWAAEKIVDAALKSAGAEP